MLNGTRNFDWLKKNSLYDSK